MNFYTVVLIFTAVLYADAKEDCPNFPDITKDSLIQFITDAESMLNFTKYDTKEIKFYVMTPRSYPDFVNPEGEDVDWSKLGCKNQEIFFNCHGFREFGLQVWSIDLARTFVEEYGGCAVSADYQESTENLNYLTVVKGNTANIAKKLGDYIADNICTVTNCSKRLQLHGHSWGAHTCGIAGYNLAQRGSSFQPARLVASDAAGPYFNKLNVSDPTSHLSPQSAHVVINIKTSKIAGGSLKEWAHQTQYVGECGSRQEQCGLKIELVQRENCDHKTSVFVNKSTMMKKFQKVKVRKCSSCHTLLTMFEDCTDEYDYLGWQSSGKPGLYIIKDLPCLNTNIDSKLRE